MYAAIVANAPELDVGPYTELLQAATIIIAADGGALALLRIGLMPQIVIGDMDSLDQATLTDLEQRQVELRRYPRAKDETDLELALLLAADLGATQIDVLGALGGRWDHTLANVAMLCLPVLRNRRVRLLDHRQALYLVQEQTQLDGNPGDTLSLLPLTPQVEGVTTHGLLYPLNDATLYFEHARGISNVLLEPPGHVQVRSGMLLVVHHDDGGAYQWRGGTPSIRVLQ
jgi:thiamine pyrophosphokinase